MRIIKLQIENIKRLIAVEISPDGNVIKISGKNGAGKTSVLDSIWWALGGTKAVQDQPIRDGQRTAIIKIDLGDLQVERKFNNKGSTLVVTDINGTKIKSPQKVLDKMMGQLTFDPLAFMRLDSKKQVTYLKELVGLDFTELDNDRQILYDNRAEAKRTLINIKAQIDSIEIHPDTPKQEIIVTELMEELKQASEHNQQIANTVSRETDIRNQLSLNYTEVETIQKQSQQLNQELENLFHWKDTHLTIEISDIEDRIANATLLNGYLSIQKQYFTLKERIENGEIVINDYNERITQFDDTKRDQLTQASFPIDGLGFEDDLVTYHDIALSQASFAEQLRISTAMAMSMNPKLRIIRITDGSMLDTDSMAQLEAIAEKYDFQVWIEVVDDSGEVGIMIEDGMIANYAQENAA